MDGGLVGREKACGTTTFIVIYNLLRYAKISLIMVDF